MTDRARLTIVWVVVVVSAILIALLGSSLLGAPAPLPRPGPRLVRNLRPWHLTGKWVMTWGGTDARVRLTRTPSGGAWSCDWCGQKWIGRWEFRPPARLEISEWLTRDPAVPPGETLHWVIDFAPGARGYDRADLRGIVNQYGRAPTPFRLRRVR